MRDYDPTPPLDDEGEPIEHFNSTILSHAYYEYVKRIGHAKAGRVLHNVPATLSPRPTFNEVARGFVARAGEIYPQDGPDPGTRSDAREAAEQAFEPGRHPHPRPPRRTARLMRRNSPGVPGQPGWRARRSAA